MSAVERILAELVHDDVLRRDLAAVELGDLLGAAYSTLPVL